MTDERSGYCKCLFYSANALARLITRLGEEAFSPTGLSPSLCFVLMIVNRKPGISPGQVADIMMLQPSTVTRLMDKLEADKYINRVHDGRQVSVIPLRKSRLLQDKILECWKHLLERYTSLLGKETASKLTADIYQAALKLELPAGTVH